MNDGGALYFNLETLKMLPRENVSFGYRTDQGIKKVLLYGAPFLCEIKQ